MGVGGGGSIPKFEEGIFGCAVKAKGAKEGYSEMVSNGVGIERGKRRGARSVAGGECIDAGSGSDLMMGVISDLRIGVILR